MNNLTLRKAGGISLGFAIGLFFFINAIACTVYSLVKKKYLLALASVLVFVGQIFSIFSYNGTLSDNDMRNAEIFSKRLDSQLLKMDLSDKSLENPKEFRNIIKLYVRNTANQLIAENEALVDPLSKITNDVLTLNEDSLLSRYSENLHDIYKRHLSTIDSNSKVKISIADFSAQDKVKIGLITKDFGRIYMIEEIGNRYGGLAIIPILLSIILSIYIFKDVFVNQKTTVNTNTTFSYTHSSFNEPVRPLSEEQVSSVLDDALKQDMPRQAQGSTFKINIESQDKIAELAGVGAIQAMNIVNERRDNGYFKNMDDFRRRISLSERVHNGLAEQLDFSMPEERRGGKGRVVEF